MNKKTAFTLAMSSAAVLGVSVGLAPALGVAAVGPASGANVKGPPAAASGDVLVDRVQDTLRDRLRIDQITVTSVAPTADRDQLRDRDTTGDVTRDRDRLHVSTVSTTPVTQQVYVAPTTAPDRDRIRDGTCDATPDRDRDRDRVHLATPSTTPRVAPGPASLTSPAPAQQQTQQREQAQLQNGNGVQHGR